VAVMTQPRSCPGNCVYCPTYKDTPQSYTPQSPAVLRATACGYDPVKQVETRLSILEKMGHPTDKVELIIMGGTFLSAPHDYQYGFIKGCFDALNAAVSPNLADAQTLNEHSRNRCVGLCLETRPDYCRPDDIRWMIELGATRVELGVQAIDDDVYRLTRRGHTVQEVVLATANLKNSGLKVHYHWMPNLPGVTLEKEMELFSLLFEDERFRPDGLKIYPTMVVEGTELERWHQQGIYKPYDEPDLIKLIADMKDMVPEYVRISRVLRDIPAVYITGGPRDSLRETVLKKMAAQGQHCRCIRCREYGHRRKQGWPSGQPQLRRLDYPASGGHEVFLSCEDENQTLYGLLRLRIQNVGLNGLTQSTDRITAVIRELHVYGAEVQLGEKDEMSVQHKGLGRRLLSEAERIAAEEYMAEDLFILSGIGARPYYFSLGYELQRGYMFKAL